MGKEFYSASFKSSILIGCLGGESELELTSQTQILIHPGKLKI